ncbi:UNVERIFIED_CONTAM: hypothetical protein HDU68_002778 [Siphonaria sp. JEL0065]|nr:hypothetical protein HDU68_002778 [Siphonaria sp. JEL0065]
MPPKRASTRRTETVPELKPKVGSRVSKRAPTSRNVSKKAATVISDSLEATATTLASPPTSPKRKATITVKKARKLSTPKPKRKYVRKTVAQKDEEEIERAIKVEIAPELHSTDDDGPFIDGPFMAGKKHVTFSPSVRDESERSPVQKTERSSCSIM